MQSTYFKQAAMRYLFLMLVSFGLNLLPQTMAISAPQSGTAQQPSSSDGNFWSVSTKLVQEQLNLIDRIERAIAQPDPNLVRAVRGQLTLHESAVERFLKSQYQLPKLLCSQSPNGSNLSQAQAEVYCSMYASTAQLKTLAPLLDRLLSRRGESAPVGPLPLAGGELRSDPILGVATFQRPNLGKPATPFFAPAPILPPAEPPIIGRTAKTPIAEYDPPYQPAIATPIQALPPLATAKQLNAQAQALFPPGTQFIQPDETRRAIERNAYDLYPQDPETYASFLVLPNTGIARILPDQVYRPQPNVLRNRLEPTVIQKFPFAPLLQREDGFTHRLALTLDGDKFQLVPLQLNYGFLADLGDVPIEKLDSNLKAATPTVRKFFLSYQPPTQLEALQVDRRRFITGKQPIVNLRLAAAQAPAVLNHTYLVRSFQFQLPENLLTGEPISRRDRRRLDQLLNISSSDVLLAFRAVDLRPDGSYTVVWRLLTENPAPQIEDLADYIKLQ